MIELLAAFILNTCINSHDSKTYHFHKTDMTCSEYYLNCAVDSEGNIQDKTLAKCATQADSLSK